MKQPPSSRVRYVDECEEMIDVVRASRALNKSKWGRQDKWAFHILKQYGGDGSRNMRTMPARLELVEAMVNRTSKIHYVFSVAEYVH